MLVKRTDHGFSHVQEQCSGRTSLHLAVDMQNLELVHTLIALGADVNSLTYGGYTPYHLTFGRHNSEIQRQLYSRTAQELRPMPESESEESEEELSSDDDCVSFLPKRHSILLLLFMWHVA